MTTALTPTVRGFQTHEHKLMFDKNSLILVDTELVNILKQALHCTPPTRDEKIATSVPLHLLGFSDDLLATYHLGSSEKSENYTFLRP